MFAIRIRNAAKEWDGRPVFQSLDLEVAVGEKVALIGANGVGKTTFLACLLGRVTFDAGQVQFGIAREDWGLLEQSPTVPDGAKLWQYAAEGLPDTPSHTAALRRALVQLGLGSARWDALYASLSGGEKTRAGLARLVARAPKGLILDEPTNHLDAETLGWLEEWLRAFAGTALFVSHDRTFIDRVADVTCELTPPSLRRYPGGYTAYKRQKDLEAQSRLALYEKQERERRELLQAIRQYRTWYEAAHEAAGIDFYKRKKAEKNSTRMKAKERALERLEANRVERPREPARPDLRLGGAAAQARVLIRLEDVTGGYGDRQLFSGLSFAVRPGDRLAVVGPNGAGKSTLLKILTGDLAPLRGSVRRHPQFRVGYFAQEADRLDPASLILEAVLAVPGISQTWARTVLAGFFFRGDEVFRRIGELSMGERCRVAFVILYALQAELLVLDEPTNYLDIVTRERLEEALAVYPGAIAIVSHDRRLLERVATRAVYLDGTRARVRDEPPARAGSDIVRGGAPVPGLRSAAPMDLRERDNLIRQWELRLTQYMAQDAPADADGQMRLLADIREAKRQLERLRGQ